MKSSRRKRNDSFKGLQEIQNNVKKYKYSLKKDIQKLRSEKYVPKNHKSSLMINLNDISQHNQKININRRGTTNSIITAITKLHKKYSKNGLKQELSTNNESLKERSSSFVANITPKNYDISGDIFNKENKQHLFDTNDYKTEPKQREAMINNFEIFEDLMRAEKNETSEDKFKTLDKRSFVSLNKKAGIEDLEMAGKELKKISDELKRLNGKMKKGKKSKRKKSHRPMM